MAILTIIPPSAEIVAVGPIVHGGVSSPGDRIVGGQAAGPLGVVKQDGQAERLCVVVLHVGGRACMDALGAGYRVARHRVARHRIRGIGGRRRVRA